MKKITSLLLVIVLGACSANAKAVEHAEAACVAEDAASFDAAVNNHTLSQYIAQNSTTFLQCVIAAAKAKAPAAK